MQCVGGGSTAAHGLFGLAMLDREHEADQPRDKRHDDLELW